VLGYYIYYRVIAEAAPALESRVRAMQAALQIETGVGGRLGKKRGEPLLWMEVYEGVSVAVEFEQTLAGLVAAHRLTEGLQSGSPRRMECFIYSGT
jgi:uncharacterized protein DUF4936